MPLIWPNDPPWLRREIKILCELKYFVQRPAEHQIKIDEYNYYWQRGTIVKDPCHRLPVKGFEALLQLLGGRGSQVKLE